MTTATCVQINRHYANFGAHAEQMLIFTLLGVVRKHDNVPFDIDSDIPEFQMSVKSSGATLASASRMVATTWEGQIDEYFQRVHSEQFAYVAQDGRYFIMNADEFRQFLLLFSSFERDSLKNGGRYKVKFRKESKKMLNWFMAML